MESREKSKVSLAEDHEQRNHMKSAIIKNNIHGHLLGVYFP